MVFFFLMSGIALYGNKRPLPPLRSINPFTKLGKSIGISVEAGKRIHLALGRGLITSVNAASSYIGLNVMQRIARVATVSDRPPVATSGDASLSLLSQDSLKSAYRSMGVQSQFNLSSGRLTGVTPFSYAVGAISVINDEESAIDVMLGNFGSEVVLIADASERNGNASLAGSDQLLAQAVLYASSEDTLIGEEMFAAGAYLKSGVLHRASLYAQDTMRWLIILGILIGVLLKLMGIL